MSTATATPRERSRREELKEVLDAVTGSIRPVPVTFGHRVAVVLVAFAMLLLPVLYAVIVQGIAYGIYWHAINNQTWFDDYGVFGMLGYGLVIAFGSIVTFFMIKPLLARAYMERPERLNPKAEPFLYDYFHALAETVGAKPPASIRVMCDVNATAGYAGGVGSVFSNKSAITIGLPLAGGLSLREFTGVMAHELGHTVQRGGGIALYFISSIFGWFDRVGTMNDIWDFRLWIWANFGSLPTRLFSRTVIFLVRLVRWVPWLLSQLGALICFNLMRKREFDADRYEVRVGGFKAFKSTTHKLHELQLCNFWAFRDLYVSAQEEKLANDLPALIVGRMKSLDAKLRKKLQREMNKEKTKLFDTHPSSRERIASARAEKTDGIFRLKNGWDPPASIIFRDFGKLSRILTRKLYKDDYGINVKRRNLRSADEILKEIDAQVESYKAVHRYFQVIIPELWPLPIDPSAMEEPGDPIETRDMMVTARKDMLAALPDYKRMAEKYEDAEGRIFELSCAMACAEVGLSVRPKDFDLETGRPSEVKKQLRKTEAAAAKAASIMLDFELSGGRRLSAALRLIQMKQVYTKIENGEELYWEVKRLIPDALYITEVMTDLRTLAVLYHQIGLLWSRFNPETRNQDLHDAIFDKVEEFHDRLTEIDGELSERLYPFDHARGNVTLKEIALPHLPPFEYISEILSVTGNLFEQLTKIQGRLFATLAAAAEKVEDVFNLPRLPQPEDDEDEDDGKKKKRKRR